MAAQQFTFTRTQGRQLVRLYGRDALKQFVWQQKPGRRALCARRGCGAETEYKGHVGKYMEKRAVYFCIKGHFSHGSELKPKPEQAHTRYDADPPPKDSIVVRGYRY